LIKATEEPHTKFVVLPNKIISGKSFRSRAAAVSFRPDLYDSLPRIFFPELASTFALQLLGNIWVDF